jgi:glycosyltransferase involved in cell wall biosynthesis
VTLPGSFAVEIDADARRVAERVLVRAAPGAAVRVTADGARALDVLLAGGPVVDASAKAGTDTTPLVRWLLDTGIVHPRPTGETWSPDDVTVVVPARNAATTIGRLVRALAPSRVVVVDDGSDDDTSAAARDAGATVLRHERSQGPAAARNTGLATVTTALVAFVDADCTPPPGWLGPLVVHLDDPAVGAVAPRIVAATTAEPGSLARYEAARSPLDQGPRPSLVGPGAANTLVPTAALVTRREALETIGGMDAALRFGEDQDLVYRLAAAGWRVRYEPAVLVPHDHRTTIDAFVRGRFAYGTPAGALAHRHGRLLAAFPVLTPARLVRLRRELDDLGVPRPAADAAVRRTLVRAARTIAHAPTRTWLPLALVAATRSRAARAGLVATLAARHLGDWRRRRPDIGAGTWFALRSVDEAALTAGTWWGAFRARTATPLLPTTDERPRRVAGDGVLVEQIVLLP